MNRSKPLALLFASFAFGCGQVRQGEGAGERGGAAGSAGTQAGSFTGGVGGAGSAGGAAGAGGSGGLVLTLAGSAGTAVVDPDVPVPLGETRQCNNEFLRVEQLPDTPLFFSGAFDGEPAVAQREPADERLPTVSIFRFGSKHVEAVSVGFALGPGDFTGLLQVGAANCEMYGNLFQPNMQGLSAFALESGALRTTTHSVDGFVGVTIGALRAKWINEAGEQHVLEADFALESYLPDARILD